MADYVNTLGNLDLAQENEDWIETEQYQALQ